MGSLAAANHRRQQLNPGLLRQGQDLIHHLIYRLPVNLPAAVGAVGNPRSGIEQAKIIIDLRHRSNSGSRIVTGGLLIDGNRRRQTLNFLYIRLLHLPQELPGIGRERLHVPPLALREDGVKCQRRLP